MKPIELKPGWLEREIKEANERLAELPEWLRRTDAINDPEVEDRKTVGEEDRMPYGLNK